MKARIVVTKDWGWRRWGKLEEMGKVRGDGER